MISRVTAVEGESEVAVDVVCFASAANTILVGNDWACLRFSFTRRNFSFIFAFASLRRSSLEMLLVVTGEGEREGKPGEGEREGKRPWLGCPFTNGSEFVDKSAEGGGMVSNSSGERGIGSCSSS